ncbi:MAG: type II toxin-antitoxin system prevent-host-death family antitoxin [Brevundimonas sp.]|uniref:type II toxin-antitoxin system Phd/YefM family antitoxin n=1 Tax=Brevundimonas sp. TaxID=1871086 RepID=UPI0025C6C8F6|nr:type II toxin-antitoxin system prevent-host-death family antitoxin [Brevundimonas sp.]MBX3476453.1 type II toxin-antitoxin system prevent-host-death family antitoxin [Brevundimonas sp.]
MTHDHVTGEVVITATEFKAKCLDLIDRLQRGALRKVTITKRGKPAAVVNQAQAEEAFDLRRMVGAMKGTVIAPAGFDWTAPMDLDPLDSENGIID